MPKLRLLPVIAAFCLVFHGTGKCQNIDIFISEYSTANINGPTDNYGEHSDWVEIRSTFSSSVSLAGYYLSDDPNNRLKWKFPANFWLQPNEVKVVWLTGRDEVVGDFVHANFSLDQCKKQWLVLSTSADVPRDCTYVYPMFKDHSRGRIANTKKGDPSEWAVFSQPSYMQVNPLTDAYDDYAPTPQIFLEKATGDWTVSAQGGFYAGAQVVNVKLNGEDYDPADKPCFDVFYTVSNYGISSDYPTPTVTPTGSTKKLINNKGFTISQTSVVRAIAAQNPTANCNGRRYLPSFCETNTYFINGDHQNFTANFGALSLGMDKADTDFFTTIGTKTLHVEYFDEKKLVCEGYAVITKPPQEKWLTEQKGFYLTMDDRLGFGCGFTGNIFNVEGLGTSSRTVFPTLHVYAGDIESHSKPIVGNTTKSFGTGIRDVFLQSLAVKNNLNVSGLHVKPIVTVKEGKYYGVFTLKEVFDKYYEEYYYGQNRDKVTMNFVQNGIEGHINYFDNSASDESPLLWRSEVYDFVVGDANNPGQPMQLGSNYEKFLERVDMSSMIDYFILNSYAANINLFYHDVAFAKGADSSKAGNKWHFCLWNAPSTFSFTQIELPQQNIDHTMGRSPCYYQETDYTPAAGLYRYSGVGEVFKTVINTSDLRGTTTANFVRAYQNRYMDLLNGPLGCDELLNHFQYIYDLYLPEMKRHDAPATSNFGTGTDAWKKNMDSLEKQFVTRCFIHEDDIFAKTDECFGLSGPYPITVDVKPAGSGSVILNSSLLEEYVWTGKYYNTVLSFKAVPTNTNYEFHHWEFKNHVPNQPASQDSVTINFSSPSGEDVIAVFTDKSVELNPNLEGGNLPTGFTPNGDGLNDVFRPVGSAQFLTNYEMVVFNRWGQEIFRSVDAQTGWDGKYKGVDALTGVYAYYVTYRNVYGEDKIVKGNVTLTR